MEGQAENCMGDISCGCLPPYLFPHAHHSQGLETCNVLLDQENSAKLTNFSLCISIPKGKKSLEVDIIAGTFGYLAPEYVRGCKIAEKSDVYSFGVLFLELLTEQKPNYQCSHGWDTVREYSRNPLDMSLNLLVRKFVSDNISKSIAGNRVKIPNEDLFHKQLQASIELALICVVRDEDSRPTMEEIATQLKNIITYSESFTPTATTREKEEQHNKENKLRPRKTKLRLMVVTRSRRKRVNSMLARIFGFY